MSCGNHLQDKINKLEHKNVRLKLQNAIIKTINQVLEISSDIAANFCLPMLDEADNFLDLRTLHDKTFLSVVVGAFDAATLVALYENFKRACKKQDDLYERLKAFHKVLIETVAKLEEKRVKELNELERKSINEMKDLLKFWKDQESIAFQGRSAFEDLKAEWDSAELEKAFRGCIQQITNLKDSISPRVV